MPEVGCYNRPPTAKETPLGRIRVLDDAMVNRIAAGEVVERPASVIKELVENSLDAGAGSVSVHLVAGGKRLIRVSDDGEGMDRDDALLALERHATSKLDEAGALRAVRTLGFRGEALPSIAAVSRFVLRTAVEDGAGTEVEVDGGRVAGVRETGLPKGTRVDVARLFANVPVRRRFLRSESTELSHGVRVVARLALANPTIRFRLDHGGRALIEAPPCSELRERVAQVLGDAARRLLAFEASRGGVCVRGFAGRPVDARARRDLQHVVVNGRLVQDRTIAHAVRQAYGNTIPRDRHPAVVMVVELDPARVDVNVHPQKSEVRFARPDEVHDLVFEALASALGQASVFPNLSELRALPGAGTVRPLEVREASPVLAPSAPRPSAPAGPTDSTDSAMPAAEPLPWSSEDRPGSRLVPLVQYRDSYIVAQDGDALVLVDQHAAHERVLFERYLAAAEEGRVEVQRLLFGPTLELPAHERVLLEEEADELGRLGFVVEPFGGNAFRLVAVPAALGDADPTVVLQHLLGEARRARSAALDVPELRRRLVTTAACHAAIKVNHPLSQEAMGSLLDDLNRTAHPSTCPHGRPVLFRLPLVEIERAFRRR